MVALFQCEPCRQIIIFFAVSDASPYVAAGRVLPKKQWCAAVGKFDSGGSRDDIKNWWQHGRIYAARRM